MRLELQAGGGRGALGDYSTNVRRRRVIKTTAKTPNRSGGARGPVDELGVAPRRVAARDNRRHAKRMGGVRPRHGAERYLTQPVTGGSRNDNGHPMTAPQWSGGSRPKPAFTPAALQASLETRQTRADEGAASLAPFISELRAAGVTTLKGIAAALNKRGVRTPLGHRRWRAMQVSRLLKRLPE